MTGQAAPPETVESVATALRSELARGEAAASSAVPILRQLVAAGDVTLFSEEIVARVRAMLADIARQLLDALIGMQGRAHSPAEVEVVGHALLDNTDLVSHLHALALEWQASEHLQSHLAVDPVASPLVQRLMSSPDDAMRRAAASFLGAQARWVQAQRRMALPLGELPADLLNVALYTLRTLAGVEPALAERATAAEVDVRRSYLEGATRLGLAAELARGLGPQESSGLDVAAAGIPLFLTTLAARTGERREDVAVSTHRSQLGRLALILRAAGLEADHVAGQCLALHSEAIPHVGFGQLRPDEATALLAMRQVPPGYPD